MFKIYDEPDSPSKRGVFNICDEQESPNERACLKASGLKFWLKPIMRACVFANGGGGCAPPPPPTPPLF